MLPFVYGMKHENSCKYFLLGIDVTLYNTGSYIAPMDFFLFLVSYSILPYGKRDTNLSRYSQALEGETLPTMLSTNESKTTYTTSWSMSLRFYK